MGLQENLYYVLFTNPISAGAYNYTKTAATTAWDFIGLKPKEVKMVNPDPIPLWKLASANGPFIKLAALSGAAAVMLGAYGAHKKYPLEESYDAQKVFETANRYHFYHTIALLGLPLCRSPLLAGTFLISGMVMFCGTCYYQAFTGDRRFNRLTPIGGSCFILGWLAMLV